MIGTLQIGLMAAPRFSPLSIAGCKLWLRGDKGINSVTPVAAPTDIAGCKLWLRGDLGITQSGGLVSAWADQSGNGNHVSQATGANQPAFAASAIGGQPGVTHISNQTFLQNTTSSILSAGSARTIFVVASPASNGGALLQIRLGGGYCATYFTGQAGFTPDARDCFTDSVDGTHNAYVAVPGTTTAAHIYEHSNAAFPSLISLTVDGVAQTVSQSAGMVNETGTTGFILNKWIAAGGYGIDGSVCEVIVYDTALSPTDAARVRMYLAARYALPVAVSAWADQSGNGNDVSQSSGSLKPTFNSSSIGGKPGLTFTGGATGTYLTGATNVTGNAGAKTTFVVMKGGNTTGGTLINFRKTFTVHCQFLNLGPTYWVGDAGADISISSPPTINGVAHIGEWGYPGGASTPTSVIDGTSYTVSGGLATGDTGATGFTIGNREDNLAAQQGWTGEICEVLVYDTVLSGANLTNVRNYLKARYGL